ncbi:MAG: O-antigen ligase family protein [Bacteroidales bacterium]|jgi:O-antigen ligase|nr:O-antigen ligase family protein [Bacteroidales bacterium]
MQDKLEGLKSYLTGTKGTYTVLYVLSSLFVGLNCLLIYHEIYWLLLLPVLMIIIYLYFFHLDKILLLITLATPLAINITQREFRVGVSIPTEPLMFGVLLMFILKLILNNDFDKRIWKHPVTIIILLQLTWILITSITSVRPLISFKFLLARLWFVVPFYLFGIHFFKQTINIRRFMWFYAIPLVGVVFFTTYNHYLWGFEQQAGHFVMEPFYNDHTAYGAILAMYIPVFFGFVIYRKYSKITRFFGFMVLLILMTALILSYCRAAWISLAMSIGVLILVLLKIKFRWVALTTIIMGIIFYTFQFEILTTLERNKQSKAATLTEHVRSISNISTDNSNLERINRWMSAFRMYRERPNFGFGPGTYQFEYAPYQLSDEKTLISTNAGDKGNAHSEYIGPLAEQGLPGMLIVVALVVAMIITGLKVYRRSRDREIKLLSMTTTLGLITYFIHGLMNNFLDTDKASVPVWGFMAILVAMDIYTSKIEDKEPEKQDTTS